MQQEKRDMTGIMGYDTKGEICTSGREGHDRK
jgi:hypothetical protein